jgi:ATP-dependent protease ClpP protease subunit
MNLDRREMRTRLQNLNRDGRWFDINNAAGDDDAPAEIRIYGTIGGWFGEITAEQFVEELDEITASEIVVSINSLGGDVFDGIAIYNALRQHDSHVTTKVDGIAASIASVIAQAGDHRIMLTAAQMMIHEAWGLAIGNSTEMRELADLLERQDNVIAGIYAARSDEEKDHFRSLMSDETWFTEEEAVENGLADEVVDPPRKAKTSDTNASNRFSEQIAAAIADLEKLTDRAEGVAAFRTDQGKTPLSDDSVESLETLIARLNDVVTSGEEPATTTTNDADAIEQEYLRFVAASLGEVST